MERPRPVPEVPDEVKRQNDQLLARMQTPGYEAGIRRFFDTDPKDYPELVAEMINDGTFRREIDEANGNDPDLAV